MKRIYFIVNNIDFLISHRSFIINEFEKKGYDVFIMGINERGAVNKLKKAYKFLRVSFSLSKTACHFFYISPLVHLLGVIPHFMTRQSATVVCTGLGYLGTSAPKIFKTIYLFVLRLYALRGANAIVQNEDDYGLFKNRLKFNEVELISGTYVKKINKNLFVSRKDFDLRKNFICISRIYRDKGIHDIVSLYEKYPSVKEKFHLHLYGPREMNNPAAYSDAEWKNIINCPLITYHGYKSNNEVHSLLSSGKFAFGILPSYREGMSRFLIECAVYGVPTITTNAPGCKDFEKMCLSQAYSVGSIEDMYKVISCAIEITYEDYLEWSKSCEIFASKHFTKSKITQGYLRML